MRLSDLLAIWPFGKFQRRRGDGGGMKPSAPNTEFPDSSGCACQNSANVNSGGPKLLAEHTLRLRALVTSAKGPQVLVPVNARVVGVAPEKAEGVVTLSFVVHEEYALFGNYLGQVYLLVMSLTRGTGTGTPKIFERKNSLVAVLPIDVHGPLFLRKAYILWDGSL